MKRILIFNGHARTPNRWGMFGEVIKRLQESPDNDIYYLDCNSAIKTPCGLNKSHHWGYCNKCNKPCLKLLKYINFDESHILKMSKVNKENFPNFKSIKEALMYNKDGYNYGLAAVSVIMTLTRDYNFEIKKWNNTIKKFFQTEYTVFKNLEHFMKLYNFDEIHTFNGRMPVMYPCVEFARKNDIDYVVYESGAKINHLLVIKNKVPHDFNFRKQELKVSFENKNIKMEEKVNLANKWFKDRRAGKFQAMESFTKDQIKDFLPKDFDISKENIVFFNSSIDEVYAFDSWKHPFAENENEILEKLFEHYKNDENKHFYLRIHPNLTKAKKKHVTQIKQINEMKKKYKNLTVIEPDDKIDTYALMEVCDKVLSTYSTTAFEATYWGKVAIIAGIAPYEDLDCVYKANSMEEFYNLIDDKNLTPKAKENTYPYAYNLETYGEKYRYYKPESRKQGNFLGMSLK